MVIVYSTLPVVVHYIPYISSIESVSKNEISFMQSRVDEPVRPGGVLEVYMTGGGSDEFFWVENLHARYFFGSRDLSCIFLGLKKIRVFFWVLPPSELFVSGFRCYQWIRKIFIRTFFQRRVFRVLVFFGLEILFPGIFWGLKFQACIFFWVCNMKLRRTPPSGILRVPPWACTAV